MQIEDYPDVAKRAQELGCAIPDSLAMLPRNFAKAESKETLIHEDTTSTIRLLWKQAEIKETPIEKTGEKIPEIVEESLDWIGPTIYFASTLITLNPTLVDIAIGVISDYLADWFKGVPKEQKRARLDVVLQTKKGNCKKIHYDGHIDGIKEIPKVVRSLHDEE